MGAVEDIHMEEKKHTESIIFYLHNSLCPSVNFLEIREFFFFSLSKNKWFVVSIILFYALYIVLCEKWENISQKVTTNSVQFWEIRLLKIYFLGKFLTDLSKILVKKIVEKNYPSMHFESIPKEFPN